MKRFIMGALIIAFFLGVTFARAQTAPDVQQALDIPQQAGSGLAIVKQNVVYIGYTPKYTESIVVFEKRSPAYGNATIYLGSTVSDGTRIYFSLGDAALVDYSRRHNEGDVYIVTETYNEVDTYTELLPVIWGFPIYLPVISGGSSFGQ